ncbi:MAG: cytochrome c [Elusimicrobia bacterium]|nr:cytochrome c [Elusimicrobiota bacterium]
MKNDSVSQDAKIVTAAGGALAAVVLAGVVGALFMRGRGAYGPTYREATADAPADPTVFENVRGKMESSGGAAQLLSVTPETLARGKALFADSCAGCHGEGGQANTPVAAVMHPAPRDLTSPRGWTRGYTLAAIYQTLSEGVSGTGMASFDTLPPADRFALAHYVQSLGRFDHKDDLAAEAKLLDAKYHLGKMVRGPNKVSVPVVMAHMAAEYDAPGAIVLPPASDVSPGARLCRRLVADPARAADVLAQVPGWREKLDVFAETVMAGAPGNGFEPAAAVLTRARWRTFQAELAARTPVRR